MPLDPDVERELDRIDSRLKMVEAVAVELPVIRVELQGVKDDIAAFHRAIEIREAERVKEQNSAKLERKSDRRWLVGTVFTATSLILAAVAILAQTLGG